MSTTVQMFSGSNRDRLSWFGAEDERILISMDHSDGLVFFYSPAPAPCTAGEAGGLTLFPISSASLHPDHGRVCSSLPAWSPVEACEVFEWGALPLPCGDCRLIPKQPFLIQLHHLPPSICTHREREPGKLRNL